MRLYYIDESGTLMGDRQPFFVLAAVGLDAGMWDQAEQRLVTLKRRLVPAVRPEDLEIKARDIRRGDGFFRGQDWNTRQECLDEARGLLIELSCEVLAVRVDKSALPDTVRSDAELYRTAFWRLLSLIDSSLQAQAAHGMLMIDSRSDMHSAVQDRRLIDAYREWRWVQGPSSAIVGLPWFGFSAFYPGLQLADIAAYTIDSASRNRPDLRRTRQSRWCRIEPGWQIADVPGDANRRPIRTPTRTQ